MMSPFGFDTRPRIPAICRSCIQLPRAPEDTIRKMVFVGGMFASISFATSLVAWVQISMSS